MMLYDAFRIEILSVGEIQNIYIYNGGLAAGVQNGSGSAHPPVEGRAEARSGTREPAAQVGCSQPLSV